jgi:anti-sigma28 factor (negative regulator of flagellin synthesis)
MKGITGNPVLDAYQRMNISKVGAAQPAGAPAGPSNTGAPATAAAEISISAPARAMAASLGSQAVDHQKIDSLKSQIAQNTYQINSSLVAERMIGAVS